MRNLRRKTLQSKDYYNKMAADYDFTKEGIYTNAHKKEIVKRSEINDGDFVLDIACGNGGLLFELSKKADINGYGIDISENMIEIAKARYPEFNFAVKSANPLDFPHSSMDIITVSCAFHHFENPQSFTEECFRALKKDGKIYIAEPYYPESIRRIANLFVFPFSKSGDIKVYNPKELKGFFEKAGFKEIEIFVKGTVLFLSAKQVDR